MAAAQGPPAQGNPAAPPTPTVTSVIPQRGPASGGTQLRILGSGFSHPTMVRVSDTRVPSFHFISDAEVQIVTPPGVPGSADIVVTVGDQDSTGPEVPFAYVAAPVITSATESGRDWIELKGNDLTPPLLSVTMGGAAVAGVDAQGGVVRIKRTPGPTGDVPIRVVTDGGASAPFTISIKPGWTRAFVFWLASVYFSMLVALLMTYMLIPGFSHSLPAQLGLLPIVIPWTGALGAVVLSLSGVIYHTVRRDWDSNYLMWHVARPLLGAAFASIAYLIIAGGVLGSGGMPNPSTSSPTQPTPSASATPSRSSALAAPTSSPTATPSPAAGAGPPPSGTAAPASTTGNTQNVFYIVLAFVIGYREQTFRTLIQRVGDVVLGPGKNGGSAAAPEDDGSGKDGGEGPNQSATG